MSWNPTDRPIYREHGRFGAILGVARLIVGAVRLTRLVLHRRVRYLVFLAVIIAGLVTVMGDSAFRITHVDVYGTLLLDRSAVVRAAGLVGQNPFTVETSTVRQRILALGVPEDVSISFHLPDTAIVQVIERQPAYVWKAETTLYLVSDDGTILGPTRGVHGRVVLVDLDQRPVRVGQKIDPRPLREAANLRNALPRVASLSPATFSYSHDLGVVISLSDGLQVAFGDDDDLDAKLRVLAPVLRAALAQNPRPRLVDLQLADHPFFR